MDGFYASGEDTLKLAFTFSIPMNPRSFQEDCPSLPEALSARFEDAHTFVLCFDRDSLQAGRHYEGTLDKRLFRSDRAYTLDDDFGFGFTVGEDCVFELRSCLKFFLRMFETCFCAGFCRFLRRIAALLCDKNGRKMPE